MLNIMATCITKNSINAKTEITRPCLEESENARLDENFEDFEEKPCIKSEVDADSHCPALEEKPELDIIISNVVCSFSVRCHLNLREIAMNGSNVEYRRENGLVRMRLRKPRTLASISSSGKITITGATSEQEAKRAARCCARSLQKLGFKVRFRNYRIVNVLGTCWMPWAVKITSFSVHHKETVQYEPEIQPGVIYKLSNLKATMRIFSSGSVTVTAPSINAIQQAIEFIYPLLYEFQKERTEEQKLDLYNKKRRQMLTQEPMIEEDKDSDAKYQMYDSISKSSDSINH